MAEKSSYAGFDFARFPGRTLAFRLIVFQPSGLDQRFLSYEKKGSTIDLSFWRAPERLFDEPDELVKWARAALAAARRVAAKGRTDSAKAKIKAVTHMAAVPSFIVANTQPFLVHILRITHQIQSLERLGL